MFSLLVKNEDKKIYKVTFGTTENYDKQFYQTWNLELICGIDYINSDENDIQGYVNADRFVLSEQHDTILVYWNEDLKSRLEEEGYKIIEELPKIY